MGGRKRRGKRSGTRRAAAKNRGADAGTRIQEEASAERATGRSGPIDKEIREEEVEAERSEGESTPGDVRSRLTYPLLDSSLLHASTSSSEAEEEEGEEEEEEEEDGRIEWSIRPRFVFVSSLCAVCLEESRVICEQCRMVSYCSPAHRKQGSARHRDLCAGLAEIARRLASDLAGSKLDADAYRAYRVHLLAILESKVSRPLELWEREIVLYPPTCRGCRAFSAELIRCSRCAMERFCPEHEADHEKWCEEFRVFRRCLYLQHRHGRVEAKIPRRPRLGESPALPGTNFDRLMRRIYGNSASYREMDSYTYAALSHASTIPLTALYAMQVSCPDWEERREWTVHVVGAEFHFEGVNLAAWETLFLHLLPNLRRLRLLLIGPELRLPAGLPVHLLSGGNPCARCRRAGRAVEVSFRPRTLYHELERDAAEPDLICAFNPGLYRATGFRGEDTWLETIEKFCTGSAPLAVTAYTADEIVWEMDRLGSVAELEVLLAPRRNPFASVKPDRNFVTDHASPLIYKNYYVCVVKAKLASMQNASM